MKPLTILILLSIITLTHCESNLPIIGKKEKTKAEKTQYAILESCWFGTLLTPPQTEYRVVDNNDGTVSLNKVDITGTNLCIIPGLGKKEKFTTLYYIKKCIQGQVYRQAQNDCKGTGTAASYYGAQKFQMCPTNSSCTESASPVVISCKNESIGNRKWEAKSFWDFTSTYLSVINYYKSRSDEIPVAPTDFYWEYLFRLTNINGTQYGVYYSGTDPTLDSLNYVLCFAN